MPDQGEAPSAFISETSFIADNSRETEDELVVLAGTAIFGATHPLSNLIPSRDGLEHYRVREGDTLSGIAARFGITVQTLRWSNPSLASVLTLGQELVILPISGLLYSVKDGDSLEAVASRYELNPQTIRDYNPDYQKILDQPGGTLILPYAKPLANAGLASAVTLPKITNYFMLPARGWNWGQLHDFNAVDIADQCGKPIYASAEGLVVEESGTGFWNQGHGSYLLVEHPNNTKTRYSHTSKNLVKVGDYVAQGDEIALIGSTGNTHGPTGCHLHFEVYGAVNPFAVR